MAAMTLRRQVALGEGAGYPEGHHEEDTGEEQTGAVVPKAVGTRLTAVYLPPKAKKYPRPSPTPQSEYAVTSIERR